MSAYPLLLIACSPFVTVIVQPLRHEGTKKESKEIYYNLCILQLIFAEHFPRKNWKRIEVEFQSQIKQLGPNSGWICRTAYYFATLWYFFLDIDLLRVLVLGSLAVGISIPKVVPPFHEWFLSRTLGV
jgi:hypothetical protein